MYEPEQSFLTGDACLDVSVIQNLQQAHRGYCRTYRRLRPVQPRGAFLADATFDLNSRISQHPFCPQLCPSGQRGERVSWTLVAPARPDFAQGLCCQPGIRLPQHPHFQQRSIPDEIAQAPLQNSLPICTCYPNGIAVTDRSGHLRKKLFEHGEHAACSSFNIFHVLLGNPRQTWSPSDCASR